MASKSVAATRGRPVGRRFTATPRGIQAAAGTCPVCHEELPRSGRWRHFRSEHSTYSRTLLVRVVSPWIFITVMFALAAGGAPGWTFVAVLIGFLGLSLWTRSLSARERAQRGLGLSGGQWVRGAGIGLLLMSVAFGIAAFLLSLAR